MVLSVFPQMHHPAGTYPFEQCMFAVIQVNMLQVMHLHAKPLGGNSMLQLELLMLAAG